MAQVNLGNSRSTPITPTEDRTSEDTGANIRALVEGIHQIQVRCRDLGQAETDLEFSNYMECSSGLLSAMS